MPIRSGCSLRLWERADKGRRTQGVRRGVKAVRKRIFRSLILLAAAVLLLSCSEEAPQILSSEYRLVLIYNPSPDAAQVHSRLALHLELEDEDAADSVEIVHLIPPAGSLSWDITADKLQRSSVDGRVWIGTNGLTLPESMLFPGGTYAVELETVRGELSSTEIGLPRQELFTRYVNTPLTLFPAATFDGIGGMLLNARGNGTITVRGYDSNGGDQGGFTVKGGYYAPASEEVSSVQSFSEWYISVRDIQTGAELVTGPLVYPPQAE